MTYDMIMMHITRTNSYMIHACYSFMHVRTYVAITDILV